MNILLRIGIAIVVFALVSYTIAITAEQRKKTVSATVLLFLTIGVCLDITATIFMIMGSSKGMISLHGLIGYSSLLVMFTDALLLWRLRNKKGANAIVPRILHLYSRYAYIWWVLAFITGGLLVAFNQ